MRKYLVIPGRVPSKNDADMHFVSAEQLMRLYDVNPKDCIIVHTDKALMQYDCSQYVSLYPRYDGDYSLSKAKEE